MLDVILFLLAIALSTVTLYCLVNGVHDYLTDPDFAGLPWYVWRRCVEQP